MRSPEKAAEAFCMYRDSLSPSPSRTRSRSLESHVRGEVSSLDEASREVTRLLRLEPFNLLPEDGLEVFLSQAVHDSLCQRFEAGDLIVCSERAETCT